MIRFESDSSGELFSGNCNSDFKHQFSNYQQRLGSGWKTALTLAIFPSTFADDVTRPQTIAILSNLIHPWTTGRNLSPTVKVIQIPQLKKKDEEQQSHIRYEAVRLEFHSLAAINTNTVSFKLVDLDTGDVVKFKNEFDIVRLNFAFVKF